MRIYGKVASIAACFGVFILIYLWVSHPADGPLLKEFAEDGKAEDANFGRQQQQQQQQRRDDAAKLVRKQAAAGVGVRTEELLKRRKDGKTTKRGVGLRAKR